MRTDGLLAMLDRWGRAALPGVVLLFFVLLTLAPLRAPYLSDALPLLPVLVVFQFSLAMPERLPGPLLLVMGVLLDLLLGGPGAPVGVSALGFVLIRAAVANNRRSSDVSPAIDSCTRANASTDTTSGSHSGGVWPQT
jgi:rod shape-determining protein MreD